MNRPPSALSSQAPRRRWFGLPRAAAHSPLRWSGLGLAAWLVLGLIHRSSPRAADPPTTPPNSISSSSTSQPPAGPAGPQAPVPPGDRATAPTPFEPPVYEVLRVRSRPQIDGRLDEPAWFAAPAIDHFEFTWHRAGAREQSVAKLLYDDEHLYVGHICQDAHITARHTQHDGPIPEDDCFEVIFAPDPAHPEVYFNIEWNVVGGYIDNHRPEGPNKPRAKVWDAEGVVIAGRHVGTLNDDTDRDQSWTCEVAIPLRNFARHMPALPPSPGSHWNLNLNRHGGQTNPQYSQWSRADTPTPSFHTPHRFGKAVFSRRSAPFDPAE